MNALRSIVAVGAGFFTTSVLALCGDYALRAWASQEFDPGASGQTAKALAMTVLYTAISGAVGGYVAATIGQVRPILHAAIVGAVLFASSAVVAGFTWSAAPPWYHLVTLAMVLPVALLGGKVREMQLKQA